jgi:Ca-activated chloride channel family protein
MIGRRPAGAVAVLAAAVAAAGVAAQQPPSFRAGVEIVSLTVTVTDAAGRYLTGLADGDFEVYEDGVRQDVSYFNRTNLPLALSLLLDTSSSMEGRIGTAQEAATGFARRLRPEDLGGLVDFDTRVQVAQPFTSDHARLEDAIRKTTAGGSTSLYNAIYVALKELKKAKARSEQELHRQAVVVLSDGEDTSSLVSYEEVLDLAKRSDTSIYTIGLRDQEEPGTKGFNEAQFVLRDLAQQTGARSFFPERVDDLSGVYDRIAEELASQYVLGYVSKNNKRDGAWRRVVVRVARPDAAARTKQGYFAPTPR